MGITALNLSLGEVNRRFYGRKLRFTAPLTRRRKTKFPTVKPPIYLPKWQIWMQLSPKYKDDIEEMPQPRNTTHPWQQRRRYEDQIRTNQKPNIKPQTHQEEL